MDYNRPICLRISFRDRSIHRLYTGNERTTFIKINSAMAQNDPDEQFFVTLSGGSCIG